jgi:hypothetical protein
MPEPASPEGRAAHLAWLGTPDCTCPDEYRKSLGKLYGIGMGPGWVRLDTDPACPHHGTEAARRDRG